MTTRAKMVQGALLLSGNRLLATPLNFLRELLVSALLGPLLYGVMNFVNFILSYASFSNLGIGAAANREILYFQGRQDPNRARLIRNTGMTASLLLSGLFGLAVLALMLFRPSISVPLVVPLAVISLIFLLTLQSWFELTAMTQRAFGVIGKLRFVSALVGFAAAVGLTYLFGLAGLLIGIVGAQCFVALWFVRMVDLRYTPTLDWGETRSLLRIGFPLCLGNLSALAFRTVDNFMVLTFLEQTQWGYYGFALFISTYLFNVVNENANVVSQFLHERYGETNDARCLRNYIVLPARMVAYFFPVAIGFIVLAAPALLLRFLPQYLPALPALEVLLVVAYCSSLVSIHGLLMVTLNRQNLNLLLRVSGIALNVLCAFVFLKAGWGLLGVALASAVSWGAYALFLTWLTTRDFTMSRKEFGLYLAELVLPLGYVLALVGGLRRFWPVSGGEISALLVQEAIFLCASVPVLIRGNAATGIVDAVASSWTRGSILGKGLKRRLKTALKRVPYFDELNFFRANIHYYARRGLGRLGVVSSPEVVMLELTNACNLKCVMCGTPTAKRKTGLMSWEVFNVALEQARDLGVRRVVLHTTGESLLHRDLPKMVREAKARGFQVFLSTNGILLDERRATELLDAGLDQLRFSIEGATKETYEAVRVGGKHERLLANMKRLHELREQRKSPMRIAVNSVYMRETASEVERFYRLYGPLVDYLEFSYLGNQGNHMPEILGRSSTVPANGGRTHPCSLLWRSMVVSWDGDVTVCCVDLENEMVVDNIAQRPLSEIWRSQAYQRYRRIHLQGRQAELKLCGECTSIQPYTSPYRQFLLNKGLKALANGSNSLASDIPIKEERG